MISALHLDQGNKECLALFARLYPGKSVHEILESQYGLLVIEALESVIDECKKDSRRGVCICFPAGA